jgi:hypothetical protein
MIDIRARRHLAALRMDAEPVLTNWIAPQDP